MPVPRRAGLLARDRRQVALDEVQGGGVGDVLPGDLRRAARTKEGFSRDVVRGATERPAPASTGFRLAPVSVAAGRRCRPAPASEVLSLESPGIWRRPRIPGWLSEAALARRSGLFSAEPAVLEAWATYLRIVGPTYAFFGLGLALYFASQGAGRLFWPLAASFVRLLIAAGGGWLAVHALGGGLAGLSVAIATALVVFGSTITLAIKGGAWR